MSDFIRLATPSDADTLARMRYAFRVSTAATNELESVFVERCTKWMRVALAPGGSWVAWVAERDGEVVGNLWLQVIEKLPNPAPEPELHAYVTNVYVEPDHRGGLGALLLETALDRCRADGVDSVILWPTDGSRTLYARYGFSVKDDLLEAVLNPARLVAH